MRVCDDIKMDFIPYLDGELSPARLREIKKHLNECEECSNDLERLKAAQDMIKKADIKLNADFEKFTSETMAKIRGSEKNINPISIFKDSFKIKPKQQLFVSAAAIILFVGLVYTGNVKKENEIMANLEMLKDYDLYQQVDMFQNFEEIENDV